MGGAAEAARTASSDQWLATTRQLVAFIQALRWSFAPGNSIGTVNGATTPEPTLGNPETQLEDPETKLEDLKPKLRNPKPSFGVPKPWRGDP